MTELARFVWYLPPFFKGHKRDLVMAAARVSGGYYREVERIGELDRDQIPVVCCTAELGPLLRSWQAERREFMYWDRGYVRRRGGLFRPLPEHGQEGYYRMHRSAFQLRQIDYDVPDDRWRALKVETAPWKRGEEIVVATTGSSYWEFHGIEGGEEGWLARTLRALAAATDRRVVVRQKGAATSLSEALRSAGCLVAHGSNAAVEAVLLGCPVVVHPTSAAALVGRTNVALVDDPLYPDRDNWLWSLAYSQFTRDEMTSGAALRQAWENKRIRSV